MHNFELSPNLPKNNDLNKKYNRFAKQLSEWYNSGKVPELASQDTRFMLELQKQKLKKLGIDMQIKFGKTEQNEGNVGALSFEDSVFVNTIIGTSKKVTTTIRNSGNEIYCSSEEGNLSVVLQNPKTGCVPPADTPLCCPNCGAPSTLGGLEDGCEFCDTKFLMDELYPKVMHIFIEKYGKLLYDKKPIKKYILFCSIGFFVLYIGLHILKSFIINTEAFRQFMEAKDFTVDKDSIVTYLYAVPASAFMGVFFGIPAWFIANIIESVRQLANVGRGGSTMPKTLIFCNKMHTLDPTFSIEYFRDKSTSLLKFMLYSSDPQELNICQCKKPIPKKIREIIDITYRNSGVTKYSIKNGVCNVSLTFYTDSLHYRNGRIIRSSDKIHMSMRKVIKKPTDLGFSFKAVNCPSCGGSFDAANVRNCPYCGNDYPFEENEWVVTDISI